MEGGGLGLLHHEGELREDNAATPYANLAAGSHALPRFVEEDELMCCRFSNFSFSWLFKGSRRRELVSRSLLRL